ncbi:HET-domain-containing protein [Lophiostoma macrostomum CBS 122681]|uniref:HET-domain-containing protein n=1 Tax=Lophiostoma macrostomum CBS 122681 TaxID=1314788 RepID=A0A6A6TKD7_9PLEO|nr:HET-domain-containing protein [Lophiostoma macrostomum CBS 122681]
MAWYAKDVSIVSPVLFPRESGGASLQDLRQAYFAHNQKDSLDVSSEAWYIPEPTPDSAKGLCARSTPKGAAGYDQSRLWKSTPTSAQSSSNVGLCMEDSVPLIGTTKVVFMAWESFTRKMRSPGDDQKLIRSWKNLCERKHGAQGHQQRPYEQQHWSAKAIDFRLIDLEDNCIVTTTWNVRYVALSYVWGGVDQLQATLANSDELSKRGSLLQETYRKRIPRTIQHAMNFVRQVGERYLWIDALCLIQDHPEKNALLDSMDKVYSAAAWCLVAASAQDANSPLHRIVEEDSAAYEKRKFSVTIQGLELGIVLPPLPTALDSSLWSKRAWTYQEGVLGRRLLLVFDEQLFFHCCHGHTYCEDVAFERLDRDNGKDTQFNGQVYFTQGHTNFEIYARAVEEFLSRKLSFEGDVLKAFQGVMTYLSSSFRGGFLHSQNLAEDERMSRNCSLLGPGLAGSGLLGISHILPYPESGGKTPTIGDTSLRISSVVVTSFIMETLGLKKTGQGQIQALTVKSRGRQGSVTTRNGNPIYYFSIRYRAGSIDAQCPKPATDFTWLAVHNI